MPVTPEIISRRHIHQSKRFYIEERTTLLPTGFKATNDIVVHPGAVVILAADKNNQLLILKQFRQTITDYLLELPAGTREIGEDPLITAKRELIEEAGVAAAHWVSLGSVYSAPGITNEQLHLYFAKDLHLETLPQDEDEVIEIQRMSTQEVENAITTGTLQDAKSIVTFFRARLAGLI
ncbi:MAG: NUDIX hydrolase [bacterium]|nr:NUDIX hydrolase [bacterium]